MQTSDVINETKQWVENVVIGLNLCPFAKKEFIKERILFSVTDAKNEEELLMDLKAELEAIQSNYNIETTLLVHPYVLGDFYDYNDFLSLADSLLNEMELEGVYQIASFHPNYQFADTLPDDIINYSNKSPYPMLHILAEESVEKAVETYPDIDSIPENNIKKLESIGLEGIKKLL
ncbi:MAG: DUF1415 domain-containing protein [Cellvibrionaceae bacterium]